MSEIVEKVRKYVEEECKNKKKEETWSHIISVVKYAKQLAKEREADDEIVEISSWLHDIGRIKGDPENHHISGGNYAEVFLLKYSFASEKRELKNHRCLAPGGTMK